MCGPSLCSVQLFNHRAFSNSKGYMAARAAPTVGAGRLQGFHRGVYGLMKSSHRTGLDVSVLFLWLGLVSLRFRFIAHLVVCITSSIYVKCYFCIHEILIILLSATSFSSEDKGVAEPPAPMEYLESPESLPCALVAPEVCMCSSGVLRSLQIQGHVARASGGASAVARCSGAR